MTSQTLQQRLAPTIVPVVAVGIAVLAIAAWLGGSLGATAAMVAIIAGLLIAALAEASASLLGLSRPLDRMLFTMLIRGGLSMAAIVAAIAGMGIDAKLVVLVAAPIYAALLLGEAAAALNADKSTEAASFETDAFQGRA